MDDFLGAAVVEKDIETAGQGDDDLLLLAEGVPSPLRPTGDIVDPVHAFNGKRDMPVLLHKGQVPTRVLDFGEREKSAVVDGGEGGHGAWSTGHGEVGGMGV